MSAGQCRCESILNYLLKVMVIRGGSWVWESKCYNCLQEGQKRGFGELTPPRLFSVMPRDTTRGNRHKLKHKRIPLNTRKHFFVVWVVLLGGIQNQTALGSPAWQGRWTKWPPKVPCNLNQPVILWLVQWTNKEYYLSWLQRGFWHCLPKSSYGKKYMNY